MSNSIELKIEQFKWMKGKYNEDETLTTDVQHILHCDI